MDNSADRRHDDFGVATEPRTVRMERLLPGPIERVWAFLTESDKRRTWLARGPMELAAGGKGELTWRHDEYAPEPAPERYRGEHTMATTVTRCEPPRLLAFLWDTDQPDGSEVIFELSEEGDKVLLVLTHRRIKDRAEMVGVSSGWHLHLDVLADRLAGQPPHAFWSQFAPLKTEYEKRILTD